MKVQFRLAEISESSVIWRILQAAIRRRKEDGSNQWQDGYPNLELVEKDIENGYGFVLCEGESIVAYSAILFNDEPEYENIKGTWLSEQDFLVFHRVAVAEKYLGKGYAKLLLENIEEFALKQKIYSIKADTNFDNLAMIHVFENLGYTYCGEVYFRGSPRKAYEKLLLPSN